MDKEKILDKCVDLFFKYGIKSMSIDDISFHLSISKKTFYQYFNNKDEVIDEIIKQLLLKVQVTCTRIVEENLDAPDKLIKIYSEIYCQFCNCAPRFFYDVQKFYPHIFQRLPDFWDCLYNLLETLIKQGKESGVFTKEINEEITIRLHQNVLRAIIEGILIPKEDCTNSTVFEIIIVNLIGISTIKGHKKLDKKLRMMSLK
ncbi:MAG TPA: TetR/AcrR family transcriptional regulator [Bacteroidales bacterium]